MDNEYIKQHYIPQFVIRGFCKSDSKTYYYDKKSGNIEQKYANEIFEEKYLYKYLFKDCSDPNIIEKDLSEFERVASEIIKKFRENDSIGLNYKDNELLKYFFFVMMLRSKYMTATYNKDIFEHNKKTKLSAAELDEFYKENLGKFAKYRCLDEVLNDNEINKQFICYAISVIFGTTEKHFVLFQSGEKTDFVLGDAYPIGMRQSVNPLDVFNRCALTCLIFPVSYNKAIALVDTYSEFHDNIRYSKIKNKDWYEKPKKFGEGYLIEKKYLTNEYTVAINKSILDGSKDGVCFRSDRRTGLLL